MSPAMPADASMKSMVEGAMAAGDAQETRQIPEWPASKQRLVQANDPLTLQVQ